MIISVTNFGITSAQTFSADTARERSKKVPQTAQIAAVNYLKLTNLMDMKARSSIKSLAAAMVAEAKESGLSSYRIYKMAGISPLQLKAVENMQGYNIDTLEAVMTALEHYAEFRPLKKTE